MEETPKRSRLSEDSSRETISPAKTKFPVRDDVGVLVLQPRPFVMFPPLHSHQMYVKSLSQETFDQLARASSEKLKRGSRVKMSQNGEVLGTDQEVDTNAVNFLSEADLNSYMDGDGSRAEMIKRYSVFKVTNVRSTEKSSKWRALSGYFIDKNGVRIQTKKPVNVKFFQGFPGDVESIEPGDKIVFFAFKISKDGSAGDFYSIMCPVEIRELPNSNSFYYLRKAENVADEFLC